MTTQTVGFTRTLPRGGGAPSRYVIAFNEITGMWGVLDTADRMWVGRSTTKLVTARVLLNRIRANNPES